MSETRAERVRQAILQSVSVAAGNRVIALQIRWQIAGEGAARPVVTHPATEAQRAANRRVEVWLSAGDQTTAEHADFAVGGPKRRKGWKLLKWGYKERYWPIFAVRSSGGLFRFVVCDFIVQRPTGRMSNAAADQYLERATTFALRIAKQKADRNPGMYPCFYIAEALREIFAEDRWGWRLILGSK
jgi:hypothetical protein